jgi:ABC-type transport system involved in cytochrome c biogenesis permease component
MRLAIPVLLLPLVMPFLIVGYLAIGGAASSMQTIPVPPTGAVVVRAVAGVCPIAVRAPC